MPVPFPFPRESVTLLASGSPKFAIFGLGTFKSGGPSSEGSIASLGFRFSIFACGGVNCVHLNLGSLPFEVGVSVWLFDPPPPPALSLPAGSFHIRRNVQRRHVHLLVFCFRGSRQDIRENRNYEQPYRRDVQAHGDHLARAKILILRPDVFHFYRF